MASYNTNKRYKKNNNYYNDAPPTFGERVAKFPIFLISGLVVVALIISSVFYLNFSNNVFKQFSKASSQNFDCGSFEYDITASIDDITHLSYDGQMEFDLEGQKLRSYYHAIYQDYEYDAAVYAQGADAFSGNYYDDQWTVSSYTDKALDFFDFYFDYRKGKFDAGAAVRFTGANSVLSAEYLDDAVDDIFKELSKSGTLNDVLHVEQTNDNNSTTVTFKPELDKVSAIILDNIGSSFASANAYSEFKKQINDSAENLKNAVAVISYTINADGYLTNINFDYTLDAHNYNINVNMGGFTTAKVDLPDGFYDAAGIEEE